MKLLMAARRFPPDVRSGTETVFENLYARARRAHEVRLVVGWQRDRSLVPPEAVAVPVGGLSRAHTWARMARAVFAEARRWRPDVILSNSIEVPPTGVPTACIVHDLNFGQSHGGLGAAARKRFYALRARRLDAVITVSAASARALTGIGVDPDRIRVVHNGVDTRVFRPDPTVPRDPERVRLAYPSRILPGKGQHLAIDAVARLRRDVKRRVHLDIVGAVADPVYLDQLRVQAHDQPVSFALDVEDIAPWYQRADIVLYPTLMTEGFGFTAVEAMACGRPVIWFDQPAIREATGGIGVAVPRGDVDALRRAIHELVEDPERREALGAEGRAYVERNLDWDRVWEEYDRTLRAIAR